MDAAKLVVKDISWYIPHCVPVSKTNNLPWISYWTKSYQPSWVTQNKIFFRKGVNTNNNWTFELGITGESFPTFGIVGFQARNKIDSQTHDTATFDWLPISNAVCKIGSEKHPDDGIECDYDRDKYDQAYSEIENFYQLKSETNLLNPFIDLHIFRRRYNFYVFDLSKQNDHIASQQIRLEFKFTAFGVADYIAYALVLTPKLISISSDGQRHLIYYKMIILMITNDNYNYKRCARSLIRFKRSWWFNFFSESKRYSIILHLFYNFQLFLYNTNQLISNNIYKDNRHFVRVYPMINFVLDLSRHACHQKDPKLVYLASEQLNCEHLNG